MEALRDDSDKAISELGSNAALDFSRERADHALESFSAGRGMDSGEDEMAGFGGAQCEAHRLGIAHFPNHEDIGIFAERIEQGLLEAGSVAADFALPDVTFLGAEGVFNRAFNGDNVTGLGAVDFLEQSRERG